MIDFEDIDQVWDYLEDNELFTNAELRLVTCINGYSLESLNECIYARYGYHDLEQMLEAEGNV